MSKSGAALSLECHFWIITTFSWGCSSMSCSSQRSLKLCGSSPPRCRLQSSRLRQAMAFFNMGGMQPGAVGVAAPRGPRPYDTDDAELNEWADGHLDDVALTKLAAVHPELRKKAMFITRTRDMAGNLRDPCSYICGILRKEAEGGPFGRQPPAWHQKPAQQQGPPLLTAQALQMVASPQHSAVSASSPAHVAPAAAPEVQPPWVVKALSMYSNRGALFRSLGGALSSQAMEALSRMPSAFQQACVLSMLISAQNYRDPDQFVSWFSSQVLANNLAWTSSGSTTSSAGSGGTDKKFAVILCGSICGSEWLGAGMGFEAFCEERQPFSVVERLHVAQPSPWQPVLDEVSQRLTPQVPFTSASPADAVGLLVSKAAAWRAQNVTALVVMFSPPPQQVALRPGAKFVGYHGSCSSEVWHYVAAVRVLKTHNVNVMLAHCHMSAYESESDAKLLDELFGPRWVLPPSSLRVPQVPFTVRSRPSSGQAATGVRRPVERPACADDIHGSLDTLFSASGSCDVELLSLIDLETILDKVASKQQLSELETVALSRVCVASRMQEGRIKLLQRNTLAALFGLDCWSINEHWAVKMPCNPLVNSETGIPVQTGHPEAVPCGEPRWCRSCSEYYESLTSCASPHLVREIVLRILQDTFALDQTLVQVAPVTLEDLPTHICAHPCCGVMS